MYQSLARLYNQIKLRLKFCDTFGEQCVNSEEDAGKVRHHKSIRDAGAKLQDESLSIGRRLEAAYELGVLSYTGGYEAGTVSADYLPTLVGLLTKKEREMTDANLVTLLEAFSSLCYVHLNNQSRVSSLGLVPALLPILAPTSHRSARTKMWLCYLLDVLCCNNVPMMRTLKRQSGLKVSLEVMETEDWSHWPRNYAAILLQVVGFKPVEQSAECGEGY